MQMSIFGVALIRHLHTRYAQLTSFNLLLTQLLDLNNTITELI